MPTAVPTVVEEPVIDPDRLLETLDVFGGLLLTLVLLFVPITVAIVLFQRWLGEDRLARLLGGGSLPVVLGKGVALGAVTPFCGCSTVPVLLGLLRGGARFAGVAAFMLASPLLNPYILGVVGYLFGVRLLVGYVLLAVSTSMLLGALWERLGLAEHVRPHVRRVPTTASSVAVPATVGATAMPTVLDAAADVDAGCGGGSAGSSCGTSADGPPAWRGLRRELPAVRGEVVATLRPMVRPVLIGLAIGALLYGVVPQTLVADLLGETRWWTLPLAAVLGLPLYLRGEAAFPIGAGLLAAGVGLGPMLAMVIAGMGASIPEVTLLSGIFRPRLLGVFLTSVLATALLGGALLPVLG